MPGMITSRHGRMRPKEPRPFSRDGVSASESCPREGAHTPHLPSQAQLMSLHNNYAQFE